MRTHPARVAASVLTALAGAIVILALAVVPFLNPAWVAFEQDRSDAAGWTGYEQADLRAATNAILVDLVLGPPDFDATVGGQPVLTETERGHMRDVRSVFAAFAALAAGAAAWLVIARWRGGAAWFWTVVRGGAVALVVGLAAAALIATLAFDAAFDLFHRLVFSGGNWAFDPATSRLVQLFPMQFWFETTLAVGAVAVVIALGAAVLARGRRGGPAAGGRVGIEAAVRLPR